MYFLLVLIELFFAKCYGRGATSEYRLKIVDFALTGASWPIILGGRGRLPPTIFLLIFRLNVLSYGIKIWTDLSSVLSQSTCLSDGRTDRQTDRHTDGQTAFLSLYHSMQRGKTFVVQNNDGTSHNLIRLYFSLVIFIFNINALALCIFVAVSILLSMTVYQVIVSGKLPSAFKSVPVIGQYASVL